MAIRVPFDRRCCIIEQMTQFLSPAMKLWTMVVWKRVYCRYFAEVNVLSSDKLACECILWIRWMLLCCYALVDDSCLECRVVWKWNVDFTKRGYSATWGTWNVDMEAYDEMKVSWTEHKTNEQVLQKVDTEREIMDTLRSQKSTEDMVRSYPKTWFITEDDVRRTNTRGKV